jgi:hypothetical protein
VLPGQFSNSIEIVTTMTSADEKVLAGSTQIVIVDQQRANNLEFGVPNRDVAMKDKAVLKRNPATGQRLDDSIACHR